MIIEIFKTITQIPRCSKTHEPFIAFVQDYAQKYGFVFEVDATKNILCYKAEGERKLSLQSHYDIVCLEDGKIPEIIEKDGYLHAKDSTLGADNGIGCAYMLDLMAKGYDLEYLFTSDEEIGLIGANNLELELKSSYMLNLDSEEEGEICIGCAGGVDIFATSNKSQIIPNDNKTLYEISLDTNQGGHSGVDIDKNIPNALKLLIQSIKECQADLIDINGGERINSIPRRAKAIIASSIKPQITHENMKIEAIDGDSEHYKKLDSNIIDSLYSFANGIRGYDKELEVVQTSINLAIVKTNIDTVEIALSGRSMSNLDLNIIKNESVSYFENFGFEVKTNGKYPAWKPETNEFTNIVHEIYKKYDENVNVYAVHAGLECAIFKEKYPHIKVASIGPNIYFPHSNNEKCEIASVYRVEKILQDIVKKMKEI